MSVERPRVRAAVQILWPAFAVAAIANAVFFAVFDPHDLTVFGRPLELSREATYTLGFLLLWTAASASSAFTLFLSAGARSDAAARSDGDASEGEPFARPAGDDRAR